MWRLKTEQEFLAEGWIKDDRQVANTICPPPGFRTTHPAMLPPKKMIDGLKLSQEEILCVLEEDRDISVKDEYGKYNGWHWVKEMFIEDTPLIPLCNCKWNKHPLFCRCK